MVIVVGRLQNPRAANDQRRPSRLIVYNASSAFMALTFITSPELAALLASKGLEPIFASIFLTRLVGLYQVNGFDLALLIPYFIVLTILGGLWRASVPTGLSLLQTQRRKDHRTRLRVSKDDMPRVTVQLPIFNEQYVVDRLLDAVCRLEYPQEKLDIQLLDDSTDETIEVARLLVKRYAALGHPVVYLHRDNREGSRLERSPRA